MEDTRSRLTSHLTWAILRNLELTKSGPGNVIHESFEYYMDLPEFPFGRPHPADPYAPRHLPRPEDRYPDRNDDLERFMGRGVEIGTDQVLLTFGGDRVPVTDCSRMREETTEHCSICQEDINLRNDVWAMTPCHHRYHFNCIKPWIVRAHFQDPKCAVCNRRIESLFRASLEPPAPRPRPPAANSGTQPRAAQQPGEDNPQLPGSVNYPSELSRTQPLSRIIAEPVPVPGRNEEADRRRTAEEEEAEMKNWWKRRDKKKKQKDLHKIWKREREEEKKREEEERKKREEEEKKKKEELDEKIRREKEELKRRLEEEVQEKMRRAEEELQKKREEEFERWKSESQAQILAQRQAESQRSIAMSTQSNASSKANRSRIGGPGIDPAARADFKKKDTPKEDKEVLPKRPAETKKPDSSKNDSRPKWN